MPCQKIPFNSNSDFCFPILIFFCRNFELCNTFISEGLQKVSHWRINQTTTPCKTIITELSNRDLDMKVFLVWSCKYLIHLSRNFARISFHWKILLDCFDLVIKYFFLSLFWWCAHLNTCRIFRKDRLRIGHLSLKMLSLLLLYSQKRFKSL